MKKILIIGMGAIGHTFATQIKGEHIVDILTSNDVDVKHISDSLGNVTHIDHCYTYDNIEYIDHDYIIVCLPFFHKLNRMNELKNIISPDSNICIVPANQGAYYYFPEELRCNPLILLERVLNIARVEEKYKKVKIFGTRKDMHISIINNPDYQTFLEIYPEFNSPEIHKSILEISLISSNATLHTSRIYNLYNDNSNYGKDILFYEDWTDEDSILFMKLENEVLALKNKIDCNLDIYDMYRHFEIEKDNINDCTYKLSSFPGFQQIYFKAENENELINNRYLVDDCIFGTYFFIKLCEKYDVACDNFKMIFNWAMDKTGNKYIDDLKNLNLGTEDEIY